MWDVEAAAERMLESVYLSQICCAMPIPAMWAASISCARASMSVPFSTARGRYLRRHCRGSSSGEVVYDTHVGSLCSYACCPLLCWF